MVLEARKKIKAEIPNPISAQSVGQLIAGLGVTRWDVLLTTDGSGQTSKTPGGWSSSLLLRRAAQILLFHGQASNCSSQEAEVRAVFEGLSAVVRMKMHKAPGGVRVHLLTDSQQVATQVSKTDPLAVAATKHHPMLWAGIRQVRRLGVELTAHHLPRNSNPLMTWMDKISGENRKAMKSQIAGSPYVECVEDILSSFPMTTKRKASQKI